MDTDVTQRIATNLNMNRTPDGFGSVRRSLFGSVEKIDSAKPKD